ncbi:MAG: hypothetical protein KC912_09770 [Proteobacteria bacterium]|nr:hypothetical protein [Pseudomonadota bacterium]
MLTLALLFSPVAHAQEVLPVERIRFYETGVAWFERAGNVQDTTRLPVPTSHLDDALKSLVVLGGDVDVGAITFPSSPGEDAARVSAGLDGNDRVSFDEALRALLGVDVVITGNKGTVRGALLDVEKLPNPPPPKDGPQTVLRPEFALTVLDEAGTLRRIDTQDIDAVKSDESAVTSRLDTAARTLSRTRAQAGSALGLQLAEGGDLALGYLTEAAVWRVSYRVLQGPSEATLQAWALIHNDTDEGWENIHVELANGEPDSFLYPLAAPRYAERPLETPDRYMSTVPQLAAETPDDMWTGSESYGSGGFGAVGHGYGGGGSSLSMGSVGSASIAAALKEAEPVQTPTQFVYRVARPLDLQPHHSALVPLVHQAVPTERAVTFTPHAREPRSGLWLENGTDRTLPAGVVSVLEAGGLAGEARLQRLKPDETQMLLIGNELDLEVDRSSTQDPFAYSQFSFRGGQVRLEGEQTHHSEFVVHNRSGRERSVWFAMELGPRAEVNKDVRTEIDPHRGWTYAIFDASAGDSTSAVAWSERSVQHHAAESLAADTYLELGESGVAEAVLMRAAAKQRDAIDDARAAQQEHEARRQRAESQLQGLRADLEAAAGGDGTTSLARRSAAVESELRQLAERDAAVQAEIDEAIAELYSILGGHMQQTAQMP